MNLEDISKYFTFLIIAIIITVIINLAISKITGKVVDMCTGEKCNNTKK